MWRLLVVLGGVGCAASTAPSNCVVRGDTIGVMSYVNTTTRIVTKCVYLTSDVSTCALRKTGHTSCVVGMKSKD